ncbi:hypothetical protein BX616_007037, partial [Lobosporangium transversale]
MRDHPRAEHANQQVRWLALNHSETRPCESSQPRAGVNTGISPSLLRFPLMAPLRPPLVTAVEFESRTPSNCASGPPGGSASAQHIAIHQSERATTDLLDKPPSSSSSSSYSSSSSSSRTPSPPLSAPLRELYIKQYNNSSDGVMQGKRPKNAFFLYKEDHSKEVKKNSPVKMSGAELVSELARLWNGEPE